MPRDTQDKNKELTRFRVRDYHRLWSSFPACSANKSIFNSSLSNIYERTIFRSYMALKKFISYNPIFSCEKMVWAYPVSLAATEGIKNFFSFPLGTEMFHFPRSASVLLTNTDDRASLYPVTGFGHLRIKGCFAPPRSLSQLCHVLHRHTVSRHPPYALNAFHIILKTRYHVIDQFLSENDTDKIKSIALKFLFSNFCSPSRKEIEKIYIPQRPKTE